MRVIPIACLRDNYAYLIHADHGREAIVVDPSESSPIFKALEETGLELVAIFNTHHHSDHVGGNRELLARFPGLKVFGHSSDRGRIPGQTEFLEHLGTFDVAGLQGSVRHIPGHTRGAIAYLSSGCIFTGDTLFVAGCGRLFEGTPAEMYASLNLTLADIPGSTKVYCGHEYTQNNLKFACSVEPGNQEAKAKLARVLEQRRRGEPTVPSTFAEERATNPFLRCNSPEIVARLGAQLEDAPSPETIFAALRAAKDAF